MSPRNAGPFGEVDDLRCRQDRSPCLCAARVLSSRPISCEIRTRDHLARPDGPVLLRLPLAGRGALQTRQERLWRIRRRGVVDDKKGRPEGRPLACTVDDPYAAAAERSPTRSRTIDCKRSSAV